MRASLMLKLGYKVDHTSAACPGVNDSRPAGHMKAMGLAMVVQKRVQVERLASRIRCLAASVPFHRLGHSLGVLQVATQLTAEVIQECQLFSSEVAVAQVIANYQ